jgi:hypothetical protein
MEARQGRFPRGQLMAGVFPICSQLIKQKEGKRKEGKEGEDKGNKIATHP